MQIQVVVTLTSERTDFTIAEVRAIQRWVESLDTLPPAVAPLLTVTETNVGRLEPGQLGLASLMA